MFIWFLVDFVQLTFLMLLGTILNGIVSSSNLYLVVWNKGMIHIFLYGFIACYIAVLILCFWWYLSEVFNVFYVNFQIVSKQWKLNSFILFIFLFFLTAATRNFNTIWRKVKKADVVLFLHFSQSQDKSLKKFQYWCL